MNPLKQDDMDTYLPQNDAEFNTWQANLLEIAEPNLELWGIIAADFNKLKPLQGKWADAYAQAENKNDRTSPEVRDKEDARAAYEKELRKFYISWLSNNSRVSNSDRERMGLTVKLETRTRISKPDTSPVGTIDFSKRMQHEIHYVDQATPGKKAKPEGTHGCEVWMKIDGTAPVEASELSYVTTATRSPCIATFEGKSAGKTAWYWLRWVNRRGETGPWSSPVSATVAG